MLTWLLLALLVLLFNPCAGKNPCSGGAGLAGPRPDRFRDPHHALHWTVIAQVAPGPLLPPWTTSYSSFCPLAQVF